MIARRLPDDDHTLTGTGYQLLASAGVAIAYATVVWPTTGSGITSASAPHLAVAALTGVVGVALPYFLLNRALPDVPTSAAAMTQNLIPVVAVVSAIVPRRRDHDRHPSGWVADRVEPRCHRSNASDHVGRCAVSRQAALLAMLRPASRARRHRERLAPDEDRPRTRRHVDAGRDVVELRARVPPQVVEPRPAGLARPVPAGYHVHVVVRAGLNVEILEADEVAAVGPAVQVHRSARPMVDAAERARPNALGGDGCGRDGGRRARARVRCREGQTRPSLRRAGARRPGGPGRPAGRRPRE